MTTPLAEIPPPKLQFFDANGDPLVGGLVFTYAAGTTTKITTWTDSTQLTPNTNPIVLDARGECSVWVPPSTDVQLDAAPPGPPGPPGPMGPSGTAGLPCAITTWTTAQLMTLNTPFATLELVPAQGADKVIIPVAILMQGIPGTVPFTTCGDWALTYTLGDPSYPNVAISPSTDIMTSLVERIDYAPLTNPMYGFMSTSGTETYTPLGDVRDSPIVLYSPNGGWDDSGGVDQGLMVSVYYLAQDSTVPVPDVPDNALYDSNAGCLEVWRETYYDNTGFDLPASFNTFRSLPIAWDTYTFQQNDANPFVLSQTAGLYRADYPCLVEIEAKLFATTLQVPFSCELAVSHSAVTGDQWGQSMAFSGAIGTVPLPPLILSAHTGPWYAEWHDTWDGNINLEDVIGLGGDVATITKVELTTKVIQVVGRIETSAVHTAGTGYVVGDYIEVLTGYIRAILRVDSIDGSDGVVTYTVIDPGRGFRAASPIATSAITGGGSGFFLNITAATTNS